MRVGAGSAAPAAWMVFAYALLMGLGYSVTASLTPALIADRFSGPQFGRIVGIDLLDPRDGRQFCHLGPASDPHAGHGRVPLERRIVWRWSTPGDQNAVDVAQTHDPGRERRVAGPLPLDVPKGLQFGVWQEGWFVAEQESVVEPRVQVEPEIEDVHAVVVEDASWVWEPLAVLRSEHGRVGAPGLVRPSAAVVGDRREGQAKSASMSSCEAMPASSSSAGPLSRP